MICMLWREDTAVDRHHIHVISDTATFLMPIYLCIFLYWCKYPLTFGRNYGVWSVTRSVKCVEKSVLNRARGTDLHCRAVAHAAGISSSQQWSSRLQEENYPLRSQILTTMQESHSVLENIVAHSSWEKRQTLLEVQLLHSKTKAFLVQREVSMVIQGPILNKWIKNHPESWC